MPVNIKRGDPRQRNAPLCVFLFENSGGSVDGKIIAVGIRRWGSKQDNCRSTECRETQLQFHVITILFFSVCLAGLIRVPEILREELHEVVLRRRVQRGDAV